jgi:hypothetical protein
VVILYDEIYMRDEEWIRLLLGILAAVVGAEERSSIFAPTPADAWSASPEPLRGVRRDHEKH